MSCCLFIDYRLSTAATIAANTSASLSRAALSFHSVPDEPSQTNNEVPKIEMTCHTGTGSFFFFVLHVLHLSLVFLHSHRSLCGKVHAAGFARFRRGFPHPECVWRNFRVDRPPSERQSRKRENVSHVRIVGTTLPVDTQVVRKRKAATEGTCPCRLVPTEQ